MGTYSITDPGGGTYSIDAPDANTAMQAYQNMRGGQGGQKPLDQYQQEAQQTLGKLKGTPADPSYGPTESYINSWMMGGLPTVMAGLNTPFEMAAHGTFNPVTGYDYAKAKQNLMLSQGQEESPVTNTLAGIAGAGTSGAMLAGKVLPAAGALVSRVGAPAVGQAITGLGATLAAPDAGLAARMLGGGIDAAAQGAATQLASGEGWDRLNMGPAALGGAIAGAGLPAAGAAIGSVARPFVSQAVSRLWPEEAAQATLARGVASSGRPIADLQQDVENAAAAGQSNYTLADALGKPGGDIVSNIARSGGEPGTEAANFLDRRQVAQGRDIASQLQQGLGVNQTAQQAEAALTAQRQAEARANYGAARNAPGAPAVDVSPAIAAADAQLTPGVTRMLSPTTGVADTSVDAAVRRARAFLTDDRSQLSNLADVHGARVEISNMMEAGTPSIREALRPIRDALDQGMITASPAYQAARDTYAAQSRAIEAVQAGRQAAQSGRIEDTIPAYNAMSPEAQAAYRTGYADPLLAQAQGGNPMANKALPLMNEASQAELANMSRYQGPLQPGRSNQLLQAIERSNRMNETFRRARTGSQTFDNLAEGAQEGLDPSALVGVAAEAARGNYLGLLMHGLRHVANAYSGSTPAVRAHLLQMMLARGPQAGDIAGMLAPRVASIRYRNEMAKLLRGGLAGAGTISGVQSAQRPTQ